jgi:serine/threonine protein kinase
MDIDTRSDIYSLGVLLYEMLSGSTPFASTRLRSTSWQEVQRIIREEDPPVPSNRVNTAANCDQTTTAVHEDLEPSKLASLLRGDLDWIVMKAMDKDRTRRYATANEFAEDVDNYLHDRPVVASPPSATYRMRKFAKRHRGSLAAATIALAALLLGLATTTGTMMWALQERSRAEDQAQRAKRFAAAVGTPFLSPADVKSFYDMWNAEIEALRADTSPDDPELVRQESQLAIWMYLHSAADNTEMQAESKQRVYNYYPHLKRVLGVKDPLILSLGSIYATAKLVSDNSQKVASVKDLWLNISPETLRELVPIYKDMQDCVDANLPAKSPQASLVRLERAIILLRLGEEQEAAQLLNGYLLWRHRHEIGDSRLVELRHESHIEIITELLADHEEFRALHELFSHLSAGREVLEDDSDV